MIQITVKKKDATEGTPNNQKKSYHNVTENTMRAFLDAHLRDLPDGLYEFYKHDDYMTLKAMDRFHHYLEIKEVG